MIAALYANGKIVTGCHHGEAFGKLTETEKTTELLSGFVDEKTLKFISEECGFYLKKIVMIRHAESDGQEWNSKVTNEGREHAKRVAAFIVNMNLGGYCGFCSPYPRCVETAAILENHCQVHFEVDQRLSKQFPSEDSETFLYRVGHVLDVLPEKSLLISHCDFIRNMAQLAVGIDVPVPEVVPNCSTTYIDNHRAIWVARDEDSR